MQSSQSKSNIQKANILLIGETHGNHEAISYEKVGMVINNQVYDAFCDAMKKGNLDKSFAIGREFFRSLDSSDVTDYDQRKCWTDLKQDEQNNITQNFIQNFEALQGNRDEHYTKTIQKEIASGKKNIIVMAGIDHIIKLKLSLTGYNITTIETMDPATMKLCQMTDDEFDTNKTLIFADDSIENMSRAIQQWVSKQQSVSQSNMSNIVDRNIATQRDNTVLSPALVDGVCGKIKQQEKQNVSQLDMSRLLDDKSHIYKEEKDSNIYKINNEDKSAVRFTKDKSHNEVISAMALALKVAIDKTKKALYLVNNVVINEAFIEKVIHFAIQNDGVGMKQSAWKESDARFKTAKRLSYEYQQAAKKNQLFTGNESTNYNNVGARLKRIPTQHIESIITQAMKVDANNRQR